MLKHGETAFLIYFIMLLILIVNSMLSEVDIINMIYLLVVLSSCLKFILIVNKNEI